MMVNDGKWLIITAWWFGTGMDYDFPYIGNKKTQLTKSCFSEG
jgi:hypothetical protein